MSMIAVNVLPLEVSPEVHRYVRARGLEPYFAALVAILRRLFADATRFDVEVHHDPEIEGLSWLLFEVEVPWDSFEQVRTALDVWYRDTAALCPAPLITTFTLSVWRR